jgi:uncharacterized membrane protein
MNIFPVADLVALGLFALAWAGYAVSVERTARGKTSLNVRMHKYREVWMQRTLSRDLRMVDTQIMSSLQNGTAFFASTTLLALGGVLSLLRYPDEMLATVADLPLAIHMTRAQWEVKVIGLILIFIYTFFKFAWSYRLFNYGAILLGAMPPRNEEATAEAKAHVRRTAGMIESAGRHFNRGQRAFFFALGYLGWFAGPYVLMVTTTATVLVMLRRQYASQSLQALIGDGDETETK